jgi:hypothetical protein
MNDRLRQFGPHRASGWRRAMFRISAVSAVALLIGMAFQTGLGPANPGGQVRAAEIPGIRTPSTVPPPVLNPYGKTLERLPIQGVSPNVATPPRRLSPAPETLFERCRKMTELEKRSNPPLYCKTVR